MCRRAPSLRVERVPLAGAEGVARGAVWGRQTHVPFDETAPKNGATSRMNYARSKLRGEDEVRAAIGRGLEAVIAAIGGATSRLTRRPPALTPEMMEGLAHVEVVDSSKAIRELGYETVSLRTMLQHALAWQIEEGLVRRPARAETLAS